MLFKFQNPREVYDNVEGDFWGLEMGKGKFVGYSFRDMRNGGREKE